MALRSPIFTPSLSDLAEALCMAMPVISQGSGRVWRNLKAPKCTDISSCFIIFFSCFLPKVIVAVNDMPEKHNGLIVLVLCTT